MVKAWYLLEVGMEIPSSHEESYRLGKWW
jgi:hypothetical protein